ncbi:hypothetical protein GSI_05918 [Ganoderma sinense ZZ0214-1]|uniref:Uncharacterized protein n=1 Tax=Ganoderma sinense ZZ0214-1 TaxID=1077348 RepID=A0A2G8SBT5_9APHY|nr:hypothetical protein GSI_05918 [Ganoderma sinense ZZ0214-1]
MHVPQARRFELTNCLDDDEPDSLVARLLRAPDLHLRIPFLSSPRVISLSCWDVAPFLLSVRCGPDGHAYLSVDYGMAHNEVWPRNEILYPNLIAIMDTLSAASVDTLEIEGSLDDLAVGTWQRVFQTFSSLRTLRLKGWGTLDFMWRGLSRASGPARLVHDGAPCCPLLSEITMIEPRVASRF